jgi:hypothetical protein
MAITSDYYGMDPREYMERMKHEMKKELYREKERIRMEAQQMYGYGETPAVQEAPKKEKPKYLNPKLLIAQGA